MALVSSLVFAVIVAFSDVFSTGPTMIEALVDFGGYNTVIFVLVCAMVVTLYLLDISYWQGGFGKVLRALCALLLTLATIALGISLVREYPYLPLCIFILLLPVAVLVISATILRNQSASSSAWALGLAFSVSSILSLTLWVAWVFGVWGGGANGNNYWHDNRAEFAQLALCNDTLQCMHVHWAGWLTTQLR